MDVTVIGAGIAGLTAARGFVELGHTVRVLDKGRRLGGRVSTRRADGGHRRFDHGAQYFTAKTDLFRQQTEDWLRRGVASIWEGRIGQSTGGRLVEKPSNPRRYVGVPGMSALAEDLAAGLDMHVETRIGSLLRVGRGFSEHPGPVDLGAVPITQAEAEEWWTWVQRDCLHHFGPFEDAMSVLSTNLFHSRLSPLLHVHRLLPRRVVDDVVRMDIPIASKEGFIRQVLGWREFMAHVHRETDGFRDLDDTEQVALPTDGGYGRWRSRPFQPSETPPRLTGHAAPARLDSVRPVPPAFWGRRSGLRCLDHVVESVWSEAYSHHIPRLMILANLATLLGISPRAITDWFWVAYVDAYDWVVEPNVLGMGTFALGDLFTTKPYVSGAAYIDRMSDYCGKCEFDPKKNCPITPLYWSFLSDNGTTLEGNARMAMPMRSLAKRKSEQRKRDRATKQWVLDTLWEGRALDPDDAP